jgi:hypothetical protein
MGYMRSFVKSSPSSIIHVKEMVLGTKENDIFACSKKVWETIKGNTFEYHTDGLIYTPANLPVGGVVRSPVAVYGRTWAKVYKWKPPSDNSIDFMVKFDTNVTIKDGQKYKRKLKLFVGYKDSYGMKVNTLDFVKGSTIITKETTAYRTKLFDLEGSNIALSEALVEVEVDPKSTMTSHPKCQNGDIIFKDNIVEMTRDENEQWIPLRVRKDKKRPNDYYTALNVWRSMEQPVTEDMITSPSEADAVKYVFDDDIYYNRVFDRNVSATRNMVVFHNNVKRRIIASLGKLITDKSVFEIACGKGNDLTKYLDAGFKTFIGVDNMMDNLENGKDGACVRALRLNKPEYKAPDIKLAFVHMDFSKRIDDAYVKGVDDLDTRTLIRLIWNGVVPTGKSSKVPMEVQNMKRFSNLATQRFSVVSCQFAIHYFLANKNMFERFLDNMVLLLQQGGYFIGTYLDGKKLDAKFKAANVKKGEHITGAIDNRVLWRVTKLYDALEGDGNNFGKEIEVFMETINKPFKEYVVDFDAIRVMCEKRGMYLIEKEHSDIQGNGSFETMHSHSSMSKPEEEYSFMNHYFVFKMNKRA